jgi:predicted RNase H-like HicB family nuclease
VQIDGIDGCQTYGPTKHEAAELIDEALAAWLHVEIGDLVLQRC